MSDSKRNDSDRMSYDLNEPFPVDWNEWRKAWAAWADEHASVLRRSSYVWPPKNLMADEVLCRRAIAYRDGSGRQVELSEVTFPALGERPRRTVRYVGITFADAANGRHTPDDPLVTTFAELEAVLDLANAVAEVVR